jgi:NAD(P)H-hydrate epimerase
MQGFPFVTAEELRAINELAGERYGLERSQLLEVAGARLAAMATEILGVLESREQVRPFCVVCGPGDNGAAGLVAARHLQSSGYRARVVVAQSEEEMRKFNLARLRTLELMGVQILRPDTSAGGPGIPMEKMPSLILDALIGCGIEGDLNPEMGRLVRWMNTVGVPILSLDVPSGLDPTTGEHGENCVKAHTTMTLALPKRGLLNPSSRQFVGRLILADIGLPRVLFRELGLEVTGRFPPGGRISLLV